MIKSDKTVEKIFQIEIVETLSNIIEISAENEQEALLKAQDMYKKEEVILYADVCIDTKFNIL
ncbi:DpnD/PcfM family protein [Psychrobacter communis]|uniref:DpnD/PcfM family protein n=1 Tax=Psychrobacter communis TaxID=2762238 RepID=A0ABR8RKT4_9GAMM|nr:DpnD/PcfM family protein [Psychrobacter communis]MBD7948366.1 DpnD/PcfM family protein [Psychrobacter communis]